MTSLRFVRRTFAPCLLAALLTGVSSVHAQSAKKRPTPAPTPKGSPPAATPGKPSPSPSAAPYVLPATVATVNGEPIKKQDLERFAETMLNTSGRKLQDLSPGEQKALLDPLLDAMILDRLVSKEAAAEPVKDLDVEARYAELMKQYPDPAAFQAQVKKAGETTDQLKTNIRSQLAQQAWLEKQIANDIKVTPEEVEKFYKESPPNKFDEPERVRARHILVGIRKNDKPESLRKDAPPEDALEAEQKAQELLARIKKGESFEEVAKQESLDPEAKVKGGDLGYFTRDRIMPEFGEVAFRLKKDEIGGPVRTQFGYHLIQVLDHQPAHTASLDEARDQIATYLQAQKRQMAVARVGENLRAKAKVERFLP